MEPIEAAMADRSRAALSAFVAEHYGLLVRRLTRHLGCPDLASDALHDAWLRLADIGSFHAVGNPKAYVYRVACNAALDRMRGNRLRQHGDGADAELAGVADHAPGPDHIAEARSDIMAIDRAMGHLPHRHRSILVGLRVHGMSRQEVAVRQGLSLRRVDTVLGQALAYCAGHLRDRPAIAASASRPRAGP